MGTFIYFISAPAVNRIKIGITNDVRTRFDGQCKASPVPLRIEAVAAGDELTEAELHWRFRDYRLHGEWFAGAQAILDTIEQTRRDGVIPGAYYGVDGRSLTYPLAGLLDAMGIGNEEIAAGLGVVAITIAKARNVGAGPYTVARLMTWLQDRGTPVPLDVLLRGGSEKRSAA